VARPTLRKVIGVRPLVYTYPYFWEQLGGTTAFRNYPLWIANYGVSEPMLPGGWRRYWIWQYSASGTVDGIPGRTDLNRLADELRLTHITYRPGRQLGRGRRISPARCRSPSGSGRGSAGDWVPASSKGLQLNEHVRPDEAPDEIPDWAFASLEKLVSERSAGTRETR
jgi:hypothetical protein